MKRFVSRTLEVMKDFRDEGEERTNKRGWGVRMSLWGLRMSTGSNYMERSRHVSPTSAVDMFETIGTYAS